MPDWCGKCLAFPQMQLNRSAESADFPDERVAMGQVGTDRDVSPSAGEREILQSLLEVGAGLTVHEDRRQVLELILRQARRLARAEAGALYVSTDGRLRFAVAQNDRLDPSQLDRHLLDAELEVSPDSLAGFVAKVRSPVNIPNTFTAPPGPFRINRAFDARTGYRTVSVLAIPLTCPDGQCVGVLQLINRLGTGGRVVAFPDDGCGGLKSLAAMAAVTLHNMELQEQLRRAHLDTIFRLSTAAEMRDDCTGRHVRRISDTSGILAAAMGLDDRRVELIRCASPMHDVGKIGIPDRILRKTAPLNDDEWAVIRRHPRIGADILAEPDNDVMAAAREIALTHHERWDGAGYPNRLAGDDIPLNGRIVGVADVFDALVSKRCYKRAMDCEEAVSVMAAERGRHFAPDVLDAFLNALDDVLACYDAPADA